MPPAEGTGERISPGAILAIAALLIGILLAGILFYQNQQQEVTDQAVRELSSIAYLKAGQIAAWREDRLYDARVISTGTFFTEGADHFLTYGDEENREKILSRFVEMNESPQYQNVLLVDPEGHVRLSLDPSVTTLSPEVRNEVAASLAEGRVVLSDFHRMPGSGHIHLDVIAPLHIRDGNTTRPVGTVLLTIDPDEFLYPFIQSWPLPGETAETLLVKREGDHVLFLTNLRHLDDTALNLTIPLTESEVPAVMAVLGTTGAFRGRDYRGVEVISVIEPVPDSSWYMIAKVDTSEAYAAWHSRAGLIIVLVFAILAGTIVVIGLFWQRRQRLYYQELYAAGAAQRRADKALRESEARFRTLVEELPIGVAMTRRDEGGEMILYVNRAFSDITGYPAASVHSFAEWAPLAYPDPWYRGEMVALAYRMYEEAARNITSSPRISRVTCRDGTVKEVEFRYTDLKVFGFWTLNDITAHRNAERDIRRMNEELARQARTLSILNRIIMTSDRVKNRPDLIRQVLDETMTLMDYDAGGIYLIDPSGETASVACSRNLPDEFVASVGTVSLKKPPYDSLLIRGEPIITNHYEQVSPDHSLKTGFLSVAAIPLYSMSGVLGSINVISRKRHTVSDEENETLLSIGRELGNALGKIAAEEALRESEKKYRELFLSITSGFAWHEIILDDGGRPVDYRFLMVNPAFEQLTGLEGTDIINKRVLDVLPGTEQTWIETYGRVALSGTSEHFENFSRELDKWYDVIVYCPKKGQFVTVFTDITDRKLAEQQREALIQELEKKNTELERFTYTVSHDLKSPLITIRGFTGLIEEDLQNGDLAAAKKDLCRITGAADTMQHLLVDLLALSRIGRIISAPEDVPFGTIAREAADLLAGPFTERGIQVMIDKEMPVVSVDRTRIREVLVNLLENATKYMGDQKEPVIRVGVRHDAKTPVFFVQDNGMGIDPRYLDRIFNLFEKLTPSIPGTGIGLPIVRRIIEVHGGKIWAESEGEGKGTTFCFTLPGPAGVDNKGGPGHAD